MTTATLETTSTTKTSRTYTDAQQAARNYMQAQGKLDELKEQGKEFKDAQEAAMKILKAEFPIEKVHADAQHIITGAWNTNLSFVHRLDDSIAYKKVLDALRLTMTAKQESDLDTLIDRFTGPKIQASLKIKA